MIYVSLGSSGDGNAYQRVLDVLSKMDVTVMTSTAGKSPGSKVFQNVLVADYLPGDLATRRASLVICNGGSLTTQQAICHGVPVLALASNLDQLLNMAGYIERGVGKLLRARYASKVEIRRNIEEMLSNFAYAQAARRLAETWSCPEPTNRFWSIISRFLSSRGVVIPSKRNVESESEALHALVTR